MKTDMDLPSSIMTLSLKLRIQKELKIRLKRNLSKMIKTILSKKMIMIMIIKYKLIKGPRTLLTNVMSNQQIEKSQTRRKRDHKEVEVGNQVIEISIKIQIKCLLETIEIREIRALKSVVEDSKEVADEVDLTMTDLIDSMIVMIGISLGEEEAEITTKTGENSMIEEILEIVETSEEEETVENIEVEEMIALKGEEVSRIEETLTMIVENFKIREIIMIKEIIKINATNMKSVIILKKENIKIKEILIKIGENSQIEGNTKIGESIKIKENSKIKRISRIQRNINMKREISKKEIGKIMTISVLMMTINHLTNRNKMEREDSPSEI